MRRVEVRPLADVLLAGALEDIQDMTVEFVMMRKLLPVKPRASKPSTRRADDPDGLLSYSDEEQEAEGQQDSIDMDEQQIRRLVDKELELFMTMDRDEEERLLDWWHANKDRLPFLAYTARRCLAAQASSAESERIFSIAGHTVSRRRMSLAPDTVELLTFIKLNHNLLDYDDFRMWMAS